jgi:hypothetical protein
VHAEPSRECDCALKFVAMLTDFRHGRVTSNHRHDAFIKMVERVSRLSGYAQQDIPGAPLARLFRHRGKLRQRATVIVPDIGETSDGINTC